MVLINPVGAFRNGYDPRRTGGFKVGHPHYEGSGGGATGGRGLESYKPEEHAEVLKKYPMVHGLAHKHKNFVRAIVAGEALKDAGDAVGWGTHHAQIMARHPKIVAYRQELEKRIEDAFVKKQSDVEIARSLLREASPEAAKILIRLMEQGEDDEMQRKCSVDILKGTKALDAEVSGASVKPAIVVAGAMLSSIEAMVKAGVLSKGNAEQEKPVIDITPELEPDHVHPEREVNDTTSNETPPDTLTKPFPAGAKAAFGSV